MKMQITRFSGLQSTKIMTVMYMLFGLIYSVIGIPMIIFGGSGVKMMGLIYLFMPIITGIMGFIFLALFMWLYNVLATRFGGVEFTTEEIGE